MRFCLITTFFPPEHFGGDAVFVAHQANLLAGAGHKVEVVHCADSFNLLRGNIQGSPVTLDKSVVVHRLHSPLGPLSPIATHITGRPFFKPLAEILGRGFDVIHWHNLSLVGGPAALSIGSAVKLCTIHDYWLLCPTSVLFRYNREICDQPKCFRCSLSYRRPPQLWRASALMRRNLSHIQSFLAPSRYVQKRFLQSSLGLKTELLPHFLPDQPSLPKPRASYYLFVGRLEKLKGLQTVIPTFVRSGRRLRIAGTGSYAAELQKLAKGLPNIEFLGRVAQKELPALYAGAIATLVPSICEETFGLTILESLQQRTPAIVSDKGALPETVEGSKGGYVFRTQEELGAILDRLDRGEEPPMNPQLREYGPQRHLERYLTLIDALQNNVEEGKRT